MSIFYLSSAYPLAIYEQEQGWIRDDRLSSTTLDESSPHHGLVPGHVSYYILMARRESMPLSKPTNKVFDTAQPSPLPPPVFPSHHSHHLNSHLSLSRRRMGLKTKLRPPPDTTVCGETPWLSKPPSPVLDVLTMASGDQWESWAQLDLCFSCLVLTSTLPHRQRGDQQNPLLRPYSAPLP